jgi:uncharacterized protein involved in exopolysaccharide biosynthesis
MWVNGRRRVDIRAWHRARQEHAAVAAERDELKAENDALKRQLAWTLHELNDVTDALRELRMAVAARQKAEHALTDLHRERAIARAKAAERDPTLPLQ